MTDRYNYIVWRHVLSEKTEEVPGGEYDRIPARYFAVPTAVIENARKLSDQLGRIEMRENTPLSWQGYGDAVDDPKWIDVFPADMREGDMRPSGLDEAEGELLLLTGELPTPTSKR